MLHVEQLESRLTPSTLTFSDGHLSYAGSADAHTVYVSDNNGEVFIVGWNASDQFFRQFSGVKSQGWQFSAADDVHYIFTSPISNGGSQFNPGEALTFLTSNGVTVNVDASPGIAAGEVWIEGLQQGGAGTFNVTMGAIAAGARADLLALNGFGVMNATITCNATVAGTFNTYIENLGGTSVNMAVTVDGKITGTAYAQAFDYNPSAASSYTLNLTAEAGSTGTMAGYEVATLGELTANLVDLGGTMSYFEAYIITLVGNASHVHTTGDVDVYLQ